MRLVLYSGGQNKENDVLHASLSHLCGAASRKRKFTYIPFCADNSNLFFKRITRRYKRFGFNEFQCLPVDTPFSARDLKQALKSDVIYLAGGNTFYLLNHLKKSGMMPELKKFVKSGGVLAGLSAGALIMTPTIKLAEIPKFEADDNDVGLKDLRGLGLTSFEFFPHYSPYKNRDLILTRYSKKTKFPIYASSDGGGIVIDGDQFAVHGKVTLFYQGDKIRLK
jgi:dipeptidase E